ncbi:hypothetical protein [Singulisphaera acidiphila]|uniref:hypothetical protein n=1 Tax=Singulisphaera acidiphila TaxID=466153 RepID=UPI001ED8D429|nr:hypothetical protein [Singulisphaera acidiphila]
MPVQIKHSLDHARPAGIAGQIRVVDADRPNQVEERLSIPDRDYTEPEPFPARRASVPRGPSRVGRRAST